MVSSAVSLPRLAGRILSTWGRLLGKAMKTPRPDVVIVGYLGHFDVLLARLRFPRALIALDYLISGASTAADRGVGSTAIRRMLGALDRLALAAADLIIVDTPAQRDRLPATAVPRAVVVPVGATGSWFRQPPPGASARLSVVFYGLFTPLQGTVTIGQALASLANDPIDVTMIGTGQDYEACRLAAEANTNVKWIDWAPGDDLPEIVRNHEVCLGIFGTSSKAQRVVPTKAFQGAAAGCVVVTSDTPVQRETLGDAARFVQPGHPEDLARALRGLAEGEDVAPSRQQAYGWADQRFRPATVVESLVERLSTEVAA